MKSLTNRIRVRGGIVSVVVLLIIHSGCVLNYDQFRNEIDQYQDWPGERDHLHILAHGLRASSSHNSQAWQIVVENTNQYLIKSVRDRWLTELDPENREQLLSLGALIENLDLASEAFGYRMEIEILISDYDDQDIARFSLIRESGNTDQKMMNLLQSTHNYKKGFKKESLSTLEVEAILNHLSLESDEEVHLEYISRDDPRFIWLRDQSILANQQQAWRDNVQAELAEYFCFSEEDKQRGIGLTPEMIDLPVIMLPFWYGFFNENSIMEASFRDGTAPKVESQIENSGGFFTISSFSDSCLDLIQAGRLYQRLLLTAREFHIEIHPVSQVLDESPFKSEVQSALKSDYPIQFILRTGQLTGIQPDYNIDAVSTASIRMPLHQAVIW